MELVVVPGSGNQDIGFSFNSASLAPATTYWLAVYQDNSAATNVGLPVTSDLSSTGLPRWSIGDDIQTDTNFDSNLESRADDRAFLFSLDANAVPEPSGIALLGLGGLALLRRRR